MNRRLTQEGSLAFAAAAVIVLAVSHHKLLSQQAPPVQARFSAPTSSQPIALDASGTLLVVANPDNNSVTFFDVAGDRNRRLAEVSVGKEPNGVALNPQGTRAYVANTVSGTLSVLSVNRDSPRIARLLQEIKVGTEPYGVALTPNGTKVYVTNRCSHSVSVIDTRTNRVIKTIENVGFVPTAIAITNDGDGDDDDETVYVTQFFGLPRPGKQDGEDDSKVGVVSVIRTVSTNWRPRFACFRLAPPVSTRPETPSTKSLLRPTRNRPTSALPPAPIRISSTASPSKAISLMSPASALHPTGLCAST